MQNKSQNKKNTVHRRYFKTQDKNCRFQIFSRNIDSFKYTLIKALLFLLVYMTLSCSTRSCNGFSEAIVWPWEMWSWLFDQVQLYSFSDFKVVNNAHLKVLFCETGLRLLRHANWLYLESLCFSFLFSHCVVWL